MKRVLPNDPVFLLLLWQAEEEPFRADAWQPIPAPSRPNVQVTVLVIDCVNGHEGSADADRRSGEMLGESKKQHMLLISC
jgi:hypothetical protein